MHQFLDFKSFEEASLDLSRPFTVLIGKNGSGKSNAIEGIELLAQLEPHRACARRERTQTVGESSGRHPIIEEARRLKRKYNQPGDRVHIWTKDKKLKSHEPDAEPEPLV